VPWVPGVRVKVTGCVVWGSMELQVPMCARKQDLPPSDQVMEPGAHRNFRDGGSGVLSCKLFFPFFLLYIASLFVDLILTGYGTLWVPFGVL
jgi:hypothetical protein